MLTLMWAGWRNTMQGCACAQVQTSTALLTTM